MPAYRQSTRTVRAPAASASVQEPPKPDIDPRTGKKDWSRYNASVVGATWDLRAPVQPPCAAGLGYTASYGVHPAEGRPTGGYRCVSFAAQREWRNDEDGWVHGRRQAPKKRRVTRANRILAEED